MSESAWAAFREMMATYLLITAGGFVVYILLCEMCRAADEWVRRMTTLYQHRTMTRPMSHKIFNDEVRRD